MTRFAIGDVTNSVVLIAIEVIVVVVVTASVVASRHWLQALVPGKIFRDTLHILL
jgi:hypothetical protein